LTDEVGRVVPIRIEDELRASYLDYAMSVIVSRALPDVRDGLKPVHRRILYTMNEMGLTRARLSQVRRHRRRGDGQVPPARRRRALRRPRALAQDFSMRYPLVDGQGNFGSVDGDPPAAMRYTEARMTAIAASAGRHRQGHRRLRRELRRHAQQPSVLPAKLPNLLDQRLAGIAVGMATNIPPHHLGEVADATIALIDDPT
jgi:DNA gyrase subunit A